MLRNLLVTLCQLAAIVLWVGAGFAWCVPAGLAAVASVCATVGYLAAPDGPVK